MAIALLNRCYVRAELVTWAAIPLVLCVTMVNARIQAMEDLSSTGLLRILEAMKPHLTKKRVPRPAAG